jgi:hypothetical protein
MNASGSTPMCSSISSKIIHGMLAGVPSCFECIERGHNPAVTSTVTLLELLVQPYREQRREEPFLSLRLMHGEEAHLLLALDDEERASLLKFARAVTAARNPER